MQVLSFSSLFTGSFEDSVWHLAVLENLHIGNEKVSTFKLSNKNEFVSCRCNWGWSGGGDNQ